MPDQPYAGDHDLLIGGPAICNFINSLVDTRCQVTPAVVYVWAAQNYLPVGRIGSRIVASKTAILAHLFRAAK
jgi:hypothetical protein